MRRRGFTIAELVTSLAVTSVIVGALASCIALTSRALPSSSNPEQAAAQLQQVVRRIADDARFATEVSVPEPAELHLTLEDQDGDGNTEAVVYKWSGTAGTQLTRQQNAAAAVPIHNSVDQAVFAWNEPSAIAAATVPTLVITISAGAADTRITQRCLNAEGP